jgi:hypothetical protein
VGRRLAGARLGRLVAEGARPPQSWHWRTICWLGWSRDGDAGRCSPARLRPEPSSGPAGANRPPRWCQQRSNPPLPLEGIDLVGVKALGAEAFALLRLRLQAVHGGRRGGF